MDARQLVAKDLGVEFETLKVGGKTKVYARTVAERSWRQRASTHASRHLVNADIVPETALLNANFPVFFARNRLSMLQLFLHPSAGQGLDTVVCIAGNDGNNNPGSSELLAFLLQGKCAQQLSSKDSEADASAAAEEVFIADAHSASLWTTAQHPYLADQSQHVTGLVANWRHCELWQHELSDDARDDYELAKINYFVNYFRSPDARSGIQGAAEKANFMEIGVPFPESAEAISIEQWPLVQAFALGDGVGEGTFFTLRHNVRSCQSVIRDLERNVDAQTLRVAVLAHVARLHKHWSDGLQVLNGIRRAANRAQLSEADVAEALTTYFEFGKLKPSNDGGGGDGSAASSQEVFRGARVLFGARSADAGATNVTAASSETATIGDDAGKAHHFTMEGQDALSGIRAARTYFLSTGANSTDGVSAVVARRLYEELVECHLNCLEQLGGLLSVHVRNLIDGRPGALSLQRFEAMLAKRVASDLSGVFDDDDSAVQALFKTASSGDNFVSVHVHGFDAAGLPAEGPGGGRFLGDVHRRNFYLEVKVNLGGGLGSLLVGDTLPALVLRDQGGRDSASWPVAPLILTTSIAYFASWQNVAEEASVNEVVRAGLDDSAFTSDDIVHFDGAAAIAAHPACTGVGIGKPNGNVPDCLILLNNGEDIDGGDDGGGGGGGGADDAAPDDDGLTVPHQCHLYGDVYLHDSGLVLRMPGLPSMPISFFEDGGDVAYAAVVDVCPHELSLLHIKLTERARDILFSNERMFLARDTTALAIALPFGSDVKRRIVGCLGGFCKNPDTVSVEPYSYALDQLALFRVATLPPYLQAAAEQDRLLLNRKVRALAGSEGSGGADVDDDDDDDDDDEGYAPGSEPEAAILVTGGGLSGKVAIAQALARELYRTGINKSADCVFDGSRADDDGNVPLDRFDLASLADWLKERRAQRAEAVQRQAPGAIVLVAPDFVSSPSAVAQLRQLRATSPGVTLRTSVHAINVESYTVSAAATDAAEAAAKAAAAAATASGGSGGAAALAAAAAAEAVRSRGTKVAPALGTLPAVFESLLPGFVSSVVLTNCGVQSTPTDALIYLRQLVETLTAGGAGKVDIVRAGGGVGDDSLRPQFSVADLLPPALRGSGGGASGAAAARDFDDARNKQWRRLLGSQVAAVAPTGASGRHKSFTGSVFDRLGSANLTIKVQSSDDDGDAGNDNNNSAGVKFSARALKDFFATQLFARGSEANRKIGEGFSVSGRAVLVDAAATSPTTRAKNEVSVGFRAAPPHFWAVDEVNSSGGGGVAWGSGGGGGGDAAGAAAANTANLVWARVELSVTAASLNTAELEKAFVAHVWEAGEVQQFQTRLSVATLTDEQKAEIKRNHISDPLPQGFYFDGANYINADRRVQKYHPDMDAFMEQYVREQLAADEAAAAGGAAASTTGGKIGGGGAAAVDDIEVIEEDAE